MAIQKDGVDFIFQDREANSPGKMLVTKDGEQYNVVVERDDDPQIEGTELNAENLNLLVDAINALQDALNTLNTTTIPNLQAAITSLQARQNFTMSVTDGVLSIVRNN